MLPFTHINAKEPSVLYQQALDCKMDTNCSSNNKDLHFLVITNDVDGVKWCK